MLDSATFFAFCLFSFLSRSHHPEVLLRKGFLKICSKVTGEHPCQCVISIKLGWNFIEIAVRYRCSPVNLLHIFRTRFSRNTPGRLLLFFIRLKRISKFLILFFFFQHLFAFSILYLTRIFQNFNCYSFFQQLSFW